MKIYGGELVASGSSTSIPVTGLATTGSNIFNGNQIVTGSIVSTVTPLVSGSSQITYSGLSGVPSGIFSGSSQLSGFGFSTTGSNTFIGNQTVNGSLSVTGNIIAQQYVVSSSVSYITESFASGSHKFGDSSDDYHDFTGSLRVTGSLTVTTTGTEFQVNNNGTNIGNALTDSHIISGSVTINPSGLFVSSSGYVGVGTITPGENLTVNGSLGLQKTGTQIWHVNVDASNNLNIVRSGIATRMIVTSDGSVGVGTTATATTLASIQSPYGILSGLIEANVSGNAYYNSGWKYYGNGTAGVFNIDTSGNFGFYTAVSGTSGNNISLGNAKVTFTNAGNVGIGTTSPTRLLDVSTAGTSYIRTSNTLNSVYVDMLSASSGGWIGTQSNHDFMLQTNNTERIRITNAGRIIVNNSTANDSGDRNLTIQGSLSATNNDIASINLTQVWNGTSYPVILSAQQDLTYGNASAAFVLKASYWNGSSVVTAERLKITSLGNMGIGVTSPQDRLDVNGSIRFRANTPNFTAVLDNGVLDYVPTSVFPTDPVIRMAAIGTSTVGANIAFHTGTSTSVIERLRITATGVVQPGANGTQDLGTASLRWGTIFTSDLSLSNGIGDYTIVEGEEKLYLYNNKNNKVYSFVLNEEDPKTATPKKS